MSTTGQQSQGPPYAPRVAGLGGLPTTLPDVPVCAVLLAIYLSFAVTNMTIFQRNRRRKHKFIPTIAIFGFCMARVLTLALRIALSQSPHNVRLAIAANVFVSAGILIVYVVNLIFAQRILRAERPMLGWHPLLKAIPTAFYALIGGALVMVITATVISVYTLNQSSLKAIRDVQLAAVTYLLVFTTLPLVVLALAHITPTQNHRDHFGEGSMLAKKLVVLAVGCLSITIAGFKAGVNWMPPRPINNPAWYHSKAAFYVFGFSLEIIALSILTLSRPDKLFFVPDGSKKPGDYSKLSNRSMTESTNDGEDRNEKDEVAKV